MDKDSRIIAITRILPDLQAFLGEVLANEALSVEAERQRLEIIKELQQLTKPPVLPPRPANLKTQTRSSVDSIESVNDNNDFASVQRKLSNIFYLRRDFEETNEHLVNGTSEEGTKNTSRKTPAKGNKKKQLGGIYEDLPNKAEIEEFETLSEEEGPRSNRSLTLTRGTNFRASLGKTKWFAKKEKPIAHDVYVSDLLLPTISGHLMEVRTNKRRWCVLKDQHLYIFKNQEEPAYIVIDLPGCDISTVPKGDRSKVSYSFKITQNGVAAMILGIEEEKDLSAWMNALITASVSKSPLSPPLKVNKSLPRGTSSHIDRDDVIVSDGVPLEGRRHTFGSLSSYKPKEITVDIDVSNYEQPTDILGLPVSLDTENYNPPLPPLPGELNEVFELNNENKLHSRCSGIYEEVTEDFLQNISQKSKGSEESLDETSNNVILGDANLKTSDENLINGGTELSRQSHSEGATSDSEYYSSDEEQCSNDRLFHDRWALHSGILYQKRPGGWNRRYCKIIDNTFKGFRNPDDPSPVVELNLSGCNVRAAEAEGKRKFIFQLNMAEGECLHFNTDTKDSLERWLEVISIAATSRLENCAALSEDELDKVVEGNSDICNSRDSISSPIPVPERVESLRRSRIIASSVVTSDSEKNAEIETSDNIPRIEITEERSENVVKEPGENMPSGALGEVSEGKSESTSEKEEKEDEKEEEKEEKVEENVEENERKPSGTVCKVNEEEKDSDPKVYEEPEERAEEKSSEQNLNVNEPDKKEPKNNDVWEKRAYPRNYNTAPRMKTGKKIVKPIFDDQSTEREAISSLDLSAKSTSPQHALYVSKKQEYTDRLNKYLDKNGQFSGFILQLTITPNSTNLTRRWAVVQNGFLRIYENYGCAAPFLRISLVEAFLKDFSNASKSRYCFLLEYGAGQSILLQTNTDQELKRWETVITLSIACHTDLFGSSNDLRRKDKIPRNSCENLTTRTTGETTSGHVTSPEVTSSGVTSSGVTSSDVTSPKTTNSGYCECDCVDGDKVSLSCTPTLIKQVLHHKSYSLSSVESDDVTSENSHESFAYRTSLAVKHRGYLRVTRGADTNSQSEFCVLKASLFSVYENDKFEKPREVFNLLYDKYKESPNGELSFTIRNDSDGVVRFECETKEDFETWKRILGDVALQEGGSTDHSPKTSSPRLSRKISSDSSDSSQARRRSSYRASMIEEESKHHEALRQLDEDLRKVDFQCDRTEYKCHVYEVRDSSGNKTIIRRWCVINDDVMHIYERETSREAVTKLDIKCYRVKDIENPQDFPFAFQLEPLKEGDEEILVIQTSNVKDFRELLKRAKSVCRRKPSVSKSDSNIQIVKKNTKKPSPLIHSKSDISLKKEVKRIFSLARKSSKGDIAADVPALGHDTWPKVTRRERKSGRRALSDTSTERPVSHSMIENTPGRLRNRMSMGWYYDFDDQYTGYLTEVRINELCRSEVRKWCVVANRQFTAYDDKNTQSPSTVIDLRRAQLVDMSHVYKNSFEFRVNNGVVQSHLYRAANDFQQWLTVLSGASADNGRTPDVGPSPKTRKDDISSQTSSKTSFDEDTAF